MRVFIALFCSIFSLLVNFGGNYALAENQLDSLRLELSMLNSQIEDLREGFENAPDTLKGLFDGKNKGKQLLKIAD